MKTMKLLFTLLFVAAFSTIGFGQITGSAHDFSSNGWNGTGEICIVCHTPHDGVAVVGAVLWNHEVTSATFTPYSSSTMSVAAGSPTGTSLLCLSCHDGTVALDNFGGTTTGNTNISPPNEIGIDLSNDHPISIAYTTTDGGGLYDPLTQNSGLGNTIDEDLLFDTNVECASCHDVHGTINDNLLRLDNAASALCLTCHNK